MQSRIIDNLYWRAAGKIISIQKNNFPDKIVDIIFVIYNYLKPTGRFDYFPLIPNNENKQTISEANSRQVPVIVIRFRWKHVPPSIYPLRYAAINSDNAHNSLSGTRKTKLSNLLSVLTEKHPLLLRNLSAEICSEQLYIILQHITYMSGQFQSIWGIKIFIITRRNLSTKNAFLTDNEITFT